MAANPLGFVILSAARSGTSLLTATLGTHPAVLAHGEIFHEKTEWHIHAEYLASRDISRRDSDPVGFVKEILSTSLGRKVVGFKLWRSQSVPACDYVLNNPDVIKIILERKNRLAALSSNLLAERTQIWNVRVEDQFVPQSLETKIFGPIMFQNFCKYHDELFGYYRTQAKGPVVELTYEQVARLHIADAVAALGLQGFVFRHKMQKLYSGDIISRFDELLHDQIWSELARIGHEEWINEDV